jgi:hypothetical protein
MTCFFVVLGVGRNLISFEAADLAGVIHHPLRDVSGMEVGEAGFGGG